MVGERCIDRKHKHKTDVKTEHKNETDVGGLLLPLLAEEEVAFPFEKL